MERSVPLVLVLLVALSAGFSGGGDRSGEPVKLMINEIVLSGSQQLNEFGETSDWVELFNAGGPIELSGGEWYLTDDKYDLHKYELPAMDLEAGAHLLLWCDGLDGEFEALHTSFSLSAQGEWIALVRSTNGVAEIIDSVSTSRLRSGPGTSFGRISDGAASWGVIRLASPGADNEQRTLALQADLSAQ